MKWNENILLWIKSNILRMYYLFFQNMYTSPVNWLSMDTGVEELGAI